MVVGDGDHDLATARICPPGPLRLVGDKGLIGAVLVLDPLDFLDRSCVDLDGVLGQSDGRDEGRVDAGVLGKAAREGGAAGGAARFALLAPFLEADKAEVVLARSCDWSVIDRA